MTERPTSIYSRQLLSGEATLRFEEPLESEFRRQYAVRTFARRHFRSGAPAFS